MTLISFEIITDETTMKMLSYRYPERSLNDPAMECCLLPLAHLQQSLPIFPPHERLATHFFSTFFFPFFFFPTTQSRRFTTHNMRSNHLSLASSLNLNKSQGGNVPGGSRVEQGSKRRMKFEPMHRSFLSPTLIDAYSISERRWSRTPHTHWHRQCVIYRSRYRRWQGCRKNKTEKSVLSCPKRILDDFTSTIGTATSHLQSSFYRPIVNDKR